MEISALTLKLILLLTPGALAAIIHKRLTIQHKKQSDFMFVIMAIMNGIFAYLILQILSIVKVFTHNIFNCCNKKEYYAIDTFKNISTNNAIPYSDIILASIISVLLGILITKLENDKTLFIIARKLKVSNKYGDENLYSHYLNSPKVGWVYVRDIGNSITYFGFIHSFSENNKFKEIVLEEVTVYNYPNSEKLYDVESIYLCFSKLSW